MPMPALSLTFLASQYLHPWYPARNWTLALLQPPAMLRCGTGTCQSPVPPSPASKHEQERNALLYNYFNSDHFRLHLWLSGVTHSANKMFWFRRIPGNMTSFNETAWKKRGKFFQCSYKHLGPCFVLFTIFINFILCGGGWGGVCTFHSMHARSEVRGQPVDVKFFLSPDGPGPQTQDSKWGKKHLYPLRYLVSHFKKVQTLV